jgi:hypothetical protein
MHVFWFADVSIDSGRTWRFNFTLGNELFISKQACMWLKISLPKVKGLRMSVYDMSVVLVASHQHVMTEKWTNVMILSGTINTRRWLVNVSLSS